MIHRPTRRHRLLAVSVSVLAALALASCSASDDGGADGPVVSEAVVPIASAIATLDPIIDVAASTTVISNIFEALTDAGGAEGVVEPQLAESWETEDNTTWQFHLAEGATWHDGEPVTAEDVVFTFETEMDPANPHATTLSNLESVRAVDEDTVEMVLKNPNAAWIVTLGQLYIVPKAVYEDLGSEAFSAAPVGSGPYLFEAATSGGGVDLVAWEDHRNGEPAVTKISYTPVTSPQAQLAGLQAGELDVVSGIPYNQIETIGNTPGLEILSGESTNSIFMGFNTTNPALADIDVREAINIAIDRSALVEELFQGYASELGSLVPSSTFGYDESIEPAAFDADAAAELIEESGYDGTPIALTYPTANMPMADEMGRAVGAYLTEIGLNVELQPLDYTTFIQQWVGKTLPGMYIFQYRNGVDAEFVITSLLTPNSRAYFTDDEITALVAEERTAVGEEERLAVISELWDVSLTQNRYYVPLVAPDAVYGITEGLEFPFNPSGILTFSY